MKNIIIGIAVLALLGLGYWGYQNMNGVPASGAGPNGTKIAQQNPVSGKMSLKDLMNLGTTQTCTFQSETPEGTTSGTSYISGQKVRTDFTTTDSAGAATEGHIIMDSSYMYTWDGLQGMKVKISEDIRKEVQEEQKNFRAEESRQQVDPSEKMDYSCSVWIADESLFTPPSNVQFSDFSKEMDILKKTMEESQETSQPQGTEGSANQCSTCDSVPAEAQAACKQALGCE